LVRVSATDHIDGGWTLEDTFFLAAELKASGIDMIDCSSGGFDGAAQNAFSAYHVPYAESVARAVGVRTMAAGLMKDSHQAEAAVRDQAVGLVGVARGALLDPNWPFRAYMELKGQTGEPPPWPKQVGWTVLGSCA
jgi:2,4-dienoyl-CoA reductase-like NADH-dependent reductase (Old Yellow Enzyme family)